MNPKPTRNANLAKFSRENLAQFGLQKCMFRHGENSIFFEKRCFYEHGFRSAGMFLYMMSMMYVMYVLYVMYIICISYVCLFIYIYIYILCNMYISLFVCMCMCVCRYYIYMKDLYIVHVFYS